MAFAGDDFDAPILVEVNEVSNLHYYLRRYIIPTDRNLLQRLPCLPSPRLFALFHVSFYLGTQCRSCTTMCNYCAPFIAAVAGMGLG